MKFGKELARQMVAEWQKAYMDYDYLKTLLNNIQSFKQNKQPQATPTPTPSPSPPPQALNRSFSLYRAFSGLTYLQRHAASEEPISVNYVNRNGSEGYETTFLMAKDEGGEYELVYFRRLDDEFNKVDEFYRMKVEEVMKEALVLNKQMDALIAFRIKVENPPPGWFEFESSGEIHRLADDIDASTAALWTSAPSGPGERESGRIPDDAVEEAGPSRRQIYKELEEDYDDDDGEDCNQKESESQIVEVEMTKNERTPLEILKRLKINNSVNSPSSTIKVILNSPIHTELKFSRENLNKVELKLRKAFIEFYHKLCLLKSYCFLNTLAFSKIMKKYDKITSRGAAKAYMNMVDNSYLGSSDEVSKLMERVEDTFIKHFSNSNRSKGMNILRPKSKKESHGITFFTGFFAGCTVALIVSLILLIRTRNLIHEKGGAEYMENMFPLYSLFGFIVLHMLMYASNIYFWRRYRINHSFIFGLKKGTELRYREVLLPSFILAALALGSVISNLDMEMDPKTHDYKELTELLPLNLVFLVIAIVLCPFNIMYRSSRYYILVCVFRACCAPLYKVTLSDFFLAEQLTSQVHTFRNLEFYICYYGWGDYKHRRNTCKSNDAYNIFYFVVAAIPYWIRFLQCLRQLFEEKDLIHGYNGLKYFLTIVAVCLRTAYNLNKGMGWKMLAWIFSAIAALFCTYWDIVDDWGLLQRHSKNRWLRDKLLITHKSVYFGAMVMNVLLRFAWLQTVLNFKVSSLHRETLIAIVASLEIIRRGIWNFFRLENEHLNNVGNYRAFKSVPLPFNYHKDEENEDD